MLDDVAYGPFGHPKFLGELFVGELLVVRLPMAYLVGLGVRQLTLNCGYSWRSGIPSR